MHAWGATQKSPFFWHCAFKKPSCSVSKSAPAGRCGALVRALAPPRQNPSFVCIAQCNHPQSCTRYPKTLLQADLVQRYALLGRHAKNPHFLTLRTSKTPILGIQKCSFWQVWCRGMRASSATPKPHIFWPCAMPTSPPTHVWPGFRGVPVIVPFPPRNSPPTHPLV